MKRLLVLVLTMAFIVSTLVIPMPAYADDTVVDSGKCGDNLTWTLTGTDEYTLTISGEGEMYDFTDSNYPADGGVPWYWKKYSIVEVNIGPGVTSIGDHAFYYCKSLRTVTISDSVTDIGYCAFFHCTSLININIPDTVTSIGDGAFYNCKSLTSIHVPNQLASIGNEVFGCCSGLTNIIIPDSVTSIGDSAFYMCSGLTGVSIPEGVTSIGTYAFSECSNLSSINIPRGVTVLSRGIFYECSSLTRIYIPFGVTSIGEAAFWRCSNLEIISIPDSVTSIERSAFIFCSGIKSIIYYGNHPRRPQNVGENNGELDNGNAYFVRISDNEYSGSSVGPKVDVWSRKMLTEGVDYVVVYDDGIVDAGTNGEVCVTFIGDYAELGSIYYPYTVMPKEANDARIDDIEDLVYTGKPCEPTPTISLDDIELIRDRDYLINYYNNVNVGNATADITFINNYTGSATWGFNIVKAENEWLIVPRDVEKVFDWTTPDMIGKSKFGGLKWTFYSDEECSSVVSVPVFAGTYYAIATVEGTTNYSSLVSEVVSVTIAKANVTIPKAIHNIVYNGREQTGIPEGELYSVTNGSAIESGDYTAVVSLKDSANYQWEDGTVSNKEIVWSISKANVQIPGTVTDLEYNGEEQTGVPGGEQYTVVNGSATEPGEYTAVVSLKDRSNWQWEDGTISDKEIVWSISKGNVQIPEAVTGLKYNGEEQTGVPDGEQYTVVNGSATEPGEYTAVASLRNPIKYQWEDGTTEDKEILWVIGEDDSPILTRIYGKSRYETALKSADALKEVLEVDKFETVVIAYGNNYADALSASSLADVVDAPIILLMDKEEDRVRTYLYNNLTPGGKIYLIGGIGVISDDFEVLLKHQDYDVERLAGTDRFGTNIAIIEEYFENASCDEVLVCCGVGANGYADALSASSIGKPILLVGPTLTTSQKEFLEDLKETKGAALNFTMIGGKGAVSEAVENELAIYQTNGSPKRLTGQNRYATSKAVADNYFAGGSRNIVLVYGNNYPDGLSAASLAYAKKAPVLLATSNDIVNEPIKECVTSLGARRCIVLGGVTLISDEAAMTIMGIQ